MPQYLFNFMGIFLSLFLFIALSTYQILDPGMTGHASYNMNKAGLLGASSADFLYLHLGLAAYAVPLGVLMMSVFKPLRLGSVLNFILINLSLCFYCECYLNQYTLLFQKTYLPSSMGGWIGQELVEYLYFWVGELGSQVFVHLLFIQAINSLSNGYVFNFCLKQVLSFRHIVKRKDKPKHDTPSQKKVRLEDTQKSQNKRDDEEYDLWQEQANKLSHQLLKYGISNKVTAIIPGPVVIRFEIQLAPGERSSKVVTLSKDLARALLISHISVIENIPGSSSIGIEIPQRKREVIKFEPLLKELTSSFKLPLILGVQAQSEPIVVDLVKLPHLLVAGSTGSGKSVGVASMLLSLIKHHDSQALRLILIDPKVLEFARYESLQHLALPIINDHEQALAALLWCVELMESRYKLMAKYKVRHIEDFRKLVGSQPQLPRMPYIVVVIDELADLMMLSKKAVEEPIARLAQKARACGIHLIIATQRPSVDIITGLIKANIPARLSYAVSSKIDSRTILDKSGGESLLGMGDAYFMMPGYPSLQRVHGAYVSDQQIDDVIEDLKVEKPNYLGDLKEIVEVLKSEA